eukprot:745864-Hanusia_phi.AAC.3
MTGLQAILEMYDPSRVRLDAALNELELLHPEIKRIWGGHLGAGPGERGRGWGAGSGGEEEEEGGSGKWEGAADEEGLGQARVQGRGGHFEGRKGQEGAGGEQEAERETGMREGGGGLGLVQGIEGKLFFSSPPLSDSSLLPSALTRYGDRTVTPPSPSRPGGISRSASRKQKGTASLPGRG